MAMSKRTAILRRGRRFRVERHALCGRAPVGGGALSATDVFLCRREAAERSGRLAVSADSIA